MIKKLPFQKNGLLLQQITLRAIKDQYQGTALGLFWSFIVPMLMLSVYTFVFSVVFQAKWGTNVSSSKLDFALALFSGLIIFNFFSETLNNAPNVITGKVNYVKKVVFPLEILPISQLFTSLFNFFTNFIVLLVFIVITGKISLSPIIALFLIILPLAVMMQGMIFLVSALGVYLRDIKQILAVLTTALMFLSPIFYPLSAIPKNLQIIIYANPIAIYIEKFRNIIISSTYPTYADIVVMFSVAILTLVTGYLFFIKTKKGFADVL